MNPVPVLIGQVVVQGISEAKEVASCDLGPHLG